MKVIFIWTVDSFKEHLIKFISFILQMKVSTSIMLHHELIDIIKLRLYIGHHRLNQIDPYSMKDYHREEQWLVKRCQTDLHGLIGPY